jgi:hypothetical protein
LYDLVIIGVIAIVAAVTLVTLSTPPSDTGDGIPPEPPAPVSSSDPALFDAFGSPLNRIRVGEQVLFQSEITNSQEKRQPYVYIVQIKNSEDMTVSLSWLRSELPPTSAFNVTQSWTPSEPGNYEVEIFVWESIEGNVILLPSKKMVIDVRRF